MPKDDLKSLLEYANDDQRRKLQAMIDHDSIRAAARAVDRDPKSLRECVKCVRRKAARQGWAPEYDLTHPVPSGLTLRGTSIRYNGDGEVEQYWNKSKIQGREREEAVQLPDPKKIVKVSTLYDQAGLVTQQWVSEKPEDAQREALWRAFAKELAEGLPRAELVPQPVSTTDALMACYPVGDHHLGMLSWRKETGADYDLKIGERLLASAIDYLVESAPACDQALIAFLGDFIHYDSFEPVTPTSRHMLDADGRYPMMVRVAIRSMRYLIDRTLRKHKSVRVIVEIGNHDLSSSIFLMECLANIYENESRVTIDTSPAHFHYFEFGDNLIGTHHGHGTKMKDLPGVMAADRPEAWGRTKHRAWWTGHIHHQQAHDFPGCSVESFRILAPADAWAAQKGYRAVRDMKSIVLHRRYGEVDRHTVTPAMFDDAGAAA